MPLGRRAPIPRAIAGDFSSFAQPPLEDDLAHHLAAERLAAILGGGAMLPLHEASSRGAQWRVSDPAIASFGETIGDDVVQNPVSGLCRGSVGLARLAGALGDEAGAWITVERVADAYVAAWERQKRTGAGHLHPIGSMLVVVASPACPTLSALSGSCRSSRCRSSRTPAGAPSWRSCRASEAWGGSFTLSTTIGSRARACTRKGMSRGSTSCSSASSTT